MGDRNAITRHFVQPGYSVINADPKPGGGFTYVTLEAGDEFVVDVHHSADIADMVDEGFLGPHRPCH